jgi:opacity protein-like surface antigen
MNMKTAMAKMGLVSTLILGLASPAAADTVAQVESDLGIGVGARIDLVPASSFKSSGGGSSQSEDGKFGAGFGLVSDYRVLRYLKAGLELTYYTVKSEHAQNRDGLFGIGPRVTGQFPFEDIGPLDALTPYAFLTLGYNRYSPGGEGSISRNGFWYQIGAGAEVMFGDFGAFVELAYEGSAMEDKQQVGLSYSAFGMGFGAKYYF